MLHRIHHADGALVLDVDEHPIGGLVFDRLLELAAQGDCRDDLAVLRAKDRHRLARMIHRPHFLVRGRVADAVWIGSRRDGAERL